MSEIWQDFDAAVGAWRLGDLPAEKLPDAALQALIAGCDTPALAQLAGMEGSGWSEIDPVTRRVFDERERELPSEDEAVKWVADGLLRRLVAGQEDPRTTVRRLGKLAWKAVDRPAFDDLLAFVGLDDDWDLVEQQIIPPVDMPARVRETAREMLARGGVRMN